MAILIFQGPQALAETPTPIPLPMASGSVVTNGSWKTESIFELGWEGTAFNDSAWPAAALFTGYGWNPGDYDPNFAGTTSKYIWYSNSDLPDQAYFRKSFSLSQVPDVAQIIIWADDYFDLYLNGNSFFTDFMGRSYVFTVDPSFLVSGTNILTVFGVDDPQPGLPATQKNSLALDFRYILNATSTPAPSDTPTATPSPAAQLEIVKSAMPGLADIGSDVIYQMVYRNTAVDEVDIVWIIDSSCSMAPYQDAISSNTASFLSQLQGSDFRVGVVDYNYFRPQDSILDNFPVPMNTDGSRHVAHDNSGVFTTKQSELSTMIMSVGIDGSGIERAFMGLQTTLDSLYTFRAGARKVFILVTDEADFDHVYLGDWDPDTGILVETANKMNSAEVSVYVIGPTPNDFLGAATNHFWDTTGGPFPEAVGITARTNGIFQNISTADWSGTLSMLGSDIKNLTALSPVVWDTLPAGVSLVGIPSPPASQSGNLITWSLTDLNAGAAATLSLTVRLDGVQGSEILNNEASVDSSVALGATSNNAPVTVMSRTASHTKTYTAIATPTSSITITQTLTWTPTYTAEATVTLTGTWSPSLTNTQTNTPMPTLTPTPTATISKTSSPTYTPPATFTPSNTPSRAPSFSRTYTPRPSKTPTVSGTVTFSGTISPTLTVSNTLTPSATLSPSLTESPTSTHTSTSTHTPTWSPTWTPTHTSTGTATITQTFTSTGTWTPTFSITGTWTPTPSQTLTWTPSQTLTFSLSPTYTLSLTPSPSQTPSFTPTFSVTTSLTLSLSPTLSATLTQSATASPTPTEKPFLSRTQTATATPEAYRIVLQIFNGAGELIDQRTLDSSPHPLHQISTDGDGVLRDSEVPLILRDASGKIIATWNGIDSDGQRVSPGSYILKIRSENDLGSTEDSSLNAIVSWAKASNDTNVFLLPNPAHHSSSQGLQIRIEAPDGFRGKIRIYTLRGELIFLKNIDVPDSINVDVRNLKWASGLYPDEAWKAGLYLVLVKGFDSKGVSIETLLRWAIL